MACFPSRYYTRTMRGLRASPLNMDESNFSLVCKKIFRCVSSLTEGHYRHESVVLHVPQEQEGRRPSERSNPLLKHIISSVCLIYSDDK